MPNPSASSNSFLNMFKFFWSCSIFLNVVKYFWPCSNIQNYKVKYHFWPCSKIFDQVQKILNRVKTIWTWSKYFWNSRWNRHSVFSEDIGVIQKFEMKFYVTALPGGILAKQIVKTDFIILRENFILRNLLHFHFFQ